MIIDQSKLERRDGLRRALGAMATYWIDKRERQVRLDAALVERVIALLRPDFETVVPLRSVSRGIEPELVRLTGNQSARSRHGVIARCCSKAAPGPEKRSSRSRPVGGRRLRDSPSFTRAEALTWLPVRADPQMATVAVDTVDRLGIPQAARYDVIVVDEAQDVITYKDLSLLDNLLTGGLDEGRWLMFMDVNNQRGLVGGYDQEAMDYLLALRPAVFILSDNCRNTREIVLDTQRLTGADVGVTGAGAGLATGSSTQTTRNPRFRGSSKS